MNVRFVREGVIVLKCDDCNKKLTIDMEIEYSSWLTEYFCDAKCAANRYFDYMGSLPVIDKEKLFKKMK